MTDSSLSYKLTSTIKCKRKGRPIIKQDKLLHVNTILNIFPSFDWQNCSLKWSTVRNGMPRLPKINFLRGISPNPPDGLNLHCLINVLFGVYSCSEKCMLCLCLMNWSTLTYQTVTLLCGTGTHEHWYTLSHGSVYLHKSIFIFQSSNCCLSEWKLNFQQFAWCVSCLYLTSPYGGPASINILGTQTLHMLIFICVEGLSYDFFVLFIVAWKSSLWQVNITCLYYTLSDHIYKLFNWIPFISYSWQFVDEIYCYEIDVHFHPISWDIIKTLWNWRLCETNY